MSEFRKTGKIVRILRTALNVRVSRLKLNRAAGCSLSMEIVRLAGKAGRGKFTIVDAGVAETLESISITYKAPKPHNRFGACGDWTGYATTRANGKSQLLGRLFMESEMHDTKNVLVYRNGWGLDNRRENLLVSSWEDSPRNRRKSNIDKTRKGFTLKFGATVHGSYLTLEEAEEEFENVAHEYGYVSKAMREELLKPVIAFIESQIAIGVVKHHIRDAPLVEDRYRLIQ